MNHRARFALVLGTVLCTAGRGAGAEPRWRVLNHEARQAIEAKDYPKLRKTLRELQPLMPGNPRILYNLAAADAMVGDRAAALAGLRNLAQMGLVYDFAADSDFASLRGSEEFSTVARMVAANKKPVTHSSLAFTLPERDLIPEDISYDPSSRQFYIASVRRSKIIRTDGRKSEDFATSQWPVFALRQDAGRGILWAATAWAPQCDGCATGGKDKSALLAFDWKSGAMKQRIESPVPGLLGDMTISSKGDLYVSEGIHGAVLRLSHGETRLERLDVPGEFPSPQTPALSKDEKTLYVPDYLRGIAAINLNPRSVTWLRPADGIALSGIDGLYIYHDSFIAVQNGTAPERIIRFSLDLRKQEILEANWPGLGEPSHGMLEGDTFYFLANTGWDQYDDQGKKQAGSGPVTSTVRKIVLKSQ